MKKDKDRGYYVTNADLRRELKKYNETKQISEELGLMILTIAKNYASKPNFSGYTYDFVSMGVERVISQLDKIKFDDKSNPFSYITRICFCQYVSVINKEKRYKSIKELLINEALLDLAHDEGIQLKMKRAEEDESHPEDIPLN